MSKTKVHVLTVGVSDCAANPKVMGDERVVSARLWIAGCLA